VKARSQVVLPAVAIVLFLIAGVSSWINHQTLQTVLFAVAALLLGVNAVWNARRT
jgi:hypothetical protein